MTIKITSTKARSVGADNGDLEHITITEGIRYVPYGHTRGKWEYVSITLTRDELETLASLYLLGKDAKAPKVA
jgi:hypothetical protein